MALKLRIGLGYSGKDKKQGQPGGKEGFYGFGQEHDMGFSGRNCLNHGPE